MAWPRSTAFWRALSLGRGLVGGGERGREAWVQLRRPDNLFQPFGATTLDRYPEDFDVVASALTTQDPRMLSFGCSSGEELVTDG